MSKTRDEGRASRPSLADVGLLADVSAQTVSRYFNGTGYVSAEARERIGAAVERLGYRPDRNARSLRVNRSDTIGVLSVGPLNYGAATILAGLTEAARRAAFPLVISHLDVDVSQPSARRDVRTALDFFLSSRVDGLVVNTPFEGTEDLVDHVWDALPLVTLSGRPASAADSATVDSYAAGVVATGHLVELGHRRVLHLAGPTDRNEAFERERGYRAALADAGLEPLELVRGDWGAASGYAAGAAVDPDAFTAVFSGNDQMALGFLSAMRARGRVAPDDYSIVGIDDMPDAQFFEPPLSSVFLDFNRLGAEAFRMIHHQIRTGERLERLVINPALVPRASSAPLR